MNGEIHHGRETTASCSALPHDVWGYVIRTLIEYDCPLIKARAREHRIWDDVYAPWATRLCEACYAKKYVKKEEYHTKYYAKIPRIILDRFETQPKDHKGGVPRSEIDRLEYMYTHGSSDETFGLIDEKCRMMLDELGLPRDVCERSETFNKIMRSRKRSMARNVFVREYKKQIRRELDDL